MNLDCKCTFPIDLASNGIPFSARSFEKIVIMIQIVFNLRKWNKIVKLKQSWIVITLFPIDLAPNVVPFGPNQSKKCNYNLNLVPIVLKPNGRPSGSKSIG